MQVKTALLSMHHLRWIDALRGVAVVGVIATHFESMLHATGLLDSFSPSAQKVFNSFMSPVR